jgi:hypothetical protein
MKDYSGGANQWLPCPLFEAGEYETLINIALALRTTSAEAERHAA